MASQESSQSPAFPRTWGLVDTSQSAPTYTNKHVLSFFLSSSLNEPLLWVLKEAEAPSSLEGPAVPVSPIMHQFSLKFHLSPQGPIMPCAPLA